MDSILLSDLPVKCCNGSLSYHVFAALSDLSNDLKVLLQRISFISISDCVRNTNSEGHGQGSSELKKKRENGFYVYPGKSIFVKFYDLIKRNDVPW